MSKRASLLVILVLSLCFSSAAADITTGLIAHWEFDGNLLDSSGNANHGTLVGGLATTTDRFGTPNAAYEFNGTNSYVFVSDSPSLSSPDSGLTQAAWIQLYGNSQVGNPFAPIIMKSTSAANQFMYRMYVSTSNDDFICVSYNNWFTFADTQVSGLLNTWHHVATVFDETSVLFYVDGARVDSVGLPINLTSNTLDLTIGADFPGVLEIFNGKIDDVRLYARALTDADINELCPVTTGVADIGRTPRVAIRDSYPNPTTGGASVDFVLQSSALVEVAVYDVLGRRVRTLRTGVLSAGPHSEAWNGRDDGGAQVPSGVYFFQLRTGRETFASRVVRVR